MAAIAPSHAPGMLGMPGLRSVAAQRALQAPHTPPHGVRRRTLTWSWVSALSLLGLGAAVKVGTTFTGSSQGRAGARARVQRFVLTPELSRWRKPFKPRIKPERADHTRFPDDERMRSRPQFAKFALMAKERCWVTSRQLEEARREIVRVSSRGAKVYLRVYPHNAITQRIADSRSGASKGKFEYWVAALKPNVVIFELDVESEELAREALKAGSRKLPFKVGFKVREEGPSLFELA
ncbi:unnamed protein product [Effrenium voratum]|nr:unnamed protein product [Effrenium voratum]